MALGDRIFFFFFIEQSSLAIRSHTNQPGHPVIGAVFDENRGHSYSSYMLHAVCVAPLNAPLTKPRSAQVRSALSGEVIDRGVRQTATELDMPATQT